MSTVTGARSVQLKINVADADAAVAFYQKAFGFHYDITRRTEDSEHSGFVFSKYGENDFFLLHLLADTDQADRPGATTFGLLVEDLAEAHERAITSGAKEVVAPRDAEGMPRNSAVKDPSAFNFGLRAGQTGPLWCAACGPGERGPDQDCVTSLGWMSISGSSGRRRGRWISRTTSPLGGSVSALGT